VRLFILGNVIFYSDSIQSVIFFVSELGNAAPRRRLMSIISRGAREHFWCRGTFLGCRNKGKAIPYTNSSLTSQLSELILGVLETLLI
jgi:hypothetical protein